MTQSQLSLSWDAHRINISHGLSSLQQKGEFVDMTLAADGHFVKVHQVIVALASPYIKELLSTIECPHPVIFLNKISYTTLCSILEYIYTGEVVVAWENLTEFAQAAKDLYIKGLEDMKLHELLSGSHTQESQVSDSNMQDVDNKETYEFTIASADCTSEQHISWQLVDNADSIKSMDDNVIDDHGDDIEALEEYEVQETPIMKKEVKIDNSSINVMQYTVSNQGSLQMILNRYMYFLKYTKLNETRQWRCIDYLKPNIKCPAQVVTKNGVVSLRVAAHTHPFHDEKILKKVRSGAVFTAISEAEIEGQKILLKSKINETIQ
ncbi:hypothetical protein K1T71_008564 [Dendrolimus kikuchii]|uniref:Uncharacterized protein n=1 Tax=Dendrolimus kikuchii TaxID=765133 RepID=A0ACC1CV49_9NEOP|nr:hypothetical protein K1T71_008564 [Dendrolimus kikuchii]